MKKLLSMLLAMMTVCCFLTGALAQTTTDAATTGEAIEISPVENGTVVPFADHNFQITLPSDWNVLEVTQAQTDAGVFFSCANPEATRTFSIAYTAFDTATDMDAVATQLAAAYPNVQSLTINDIPFVSYTVSDSDVTGIVTLGGDGMGMYQFVFYPASDADYGPLALQIAASIDTIQ